MTAAKDAKEKKKFDFKDICDKMDVLGKGVDANSEVDMAQFGDTMDGLTAVFDGLGSHFAFAFADLADKITVIKTHAEACPTTGAMLDKDINAKNMPPSDKALDKLPVSTTRAVNRCTHVCSFLTFLFDNLIKDPKLELKPALKTAYPETLAKIHVFLVRQGVKAAFQFTPYRKDFLAKIGVTEEQLKENGPKFIAASNKITKKIEEIHKNKKVPFVF